MFDWIKSILDTNKIQFNENVLNSWLGVLYMLIFIFGMQSTIVGKSISWEFMNFIVIALIFCAYFLNIHIPYYFFIPIVLIYMIFNASITYWQSWLHAASIILTYWSFNYIRTMRSKRYQFINYMIVGSFWGAVLWFFVTIKFGLTRNIFLQEWLYLIIFEVLLYSYVTMLLRESDLRGHLVAFANHDALTKTENYAAYDNEMKYMFTDSRGNNLNLSMMMFDIDHFKVVNDTYGHLAGDTVLQQVVDEVQTVIDENDPNVKLYRTGGEEFNILFPGYDLSATEPIVREIFASLNNLNIDVGENSINISVSIGVSTVSKRDLEPDDFYNRVDRNLYHSKENGRMQITAK